MVPLPALTSGLMRGFAEDTDDALRGRRFFVIKVTRPDMFSTDRTGCSSTASPPPTSGRAYSRIERQLLDPIILLVYTLEFVKPI